MKKFYFISGLPRSGSTLLCNVLAQNPRFHSTHTSGCLDIIFGVRNVWDKLIEHRAHPDDCKKLQVMKGILHSYYEDVNKPVIIDKSRGWLAYIEMIEWILSEPPKIIVPIRSIPEVLASMEKLHRETSKTVQPPGESDNYFQMQTVAGRCAYWFRQDQVVGLAYNRIVDAIRRGYHDNVLLVPYESFTLNPMHALKEIYSFLDEAYFDHNIQNVEQVTVEDDEMHGYKGLHKIRSSIKPTERVAFNILGEELSKNYLPFNRNLI